MHNVYENTVRNMTSSTPIRDVRNESVDESDLKPPEITVIAPGQYGQWSLVRSTIFKGMYTARHPLHKEEWIDAPNDAAALAQFRRFVRTKAVRT